MELKQKKKLENIFKVKYFVPKEYFCLVYNTCKIKIERNSTKNTKNPLYMYVCMYVYMYVRLMNTHTHAPTHPVHAHTHPHPHRYTLYTVYTLHQDWLSVLPSACALPRLTHFHHRLMYHHHHHYHSEKFKYTYNFIMTLCYG